MPLIVIGIAAVTDFAAVSAVVGLSPERDTTQPERCGNCAPALSGWWR
jgi:hypothetical protein